MFTVIAYDIPDDKRRNKLVKLLKNYGKRVQFSVFEAMLDNNQVQKMIQRAKQLIDPKQDSVRVYRICAECEKNLTILGLGERYIMEPFIIA
jgi:CRISPR-associated protein Cas2